MQQTAWFWCGLCILTMGTMCLSEDDGATARQAKYRTQSKLEPDQLVFRTYPVADLVTPMPNEIKVGADAVEPIPAKAVFHFDPLIAHIKKVTGAQTWKPGGGEIKSLPQTLSLVIRQTQEMHERIADELHRLRKTQDLQVATETIIVSGPRNVIAETATAFPGELGRFEQEQFREILQKSKSLKINIAPKITTFNRQTAVINSDGKSLVTHSVIADDRRMIRLKAAYLPENRLAESISVCQTFDLHDGRAAVIRFEAQATHGVIPPADDAEECLVFLLPRIIVQEEEEVLLGLPTVSANAK